MSIHYLSEKTNFEKVGNERKPFKLLGFSVCLASRDEISLSLSP